MRYFDRLHDIAKSRGYYTEDSDHLEPANEATTGPITGLIKKALFTGAMAKVLKPKPSKVTNPTPLDKIKVGDKVDVYGIKDNKRNFQYAVVLAIDPARGELRVQGDQGSKNLNANDFMFVKVS